MLGRYRRRRLGPAFAWLGVAFYSSEIPARADRHVIAACASSVEQAAGGMGFADVGIGTEITAHAGIRSRTKGRARSQRTARHRPRQLPPRATSPFEARGSPRRFRQIYPSRVANTGAIQGVNSAAH